MKLTLKNLVLEEPQVQWFKRITPFGRRALLDACQIVILTTNDKKTRMAAENMKKYFRELTKGEKNRFETEETREEKQLKSTQHHFDATS